MAVFDLLGRRWAMGIIWHLNTGPKSFRALQSDCETISPSILNTRLKDLRQAGLITRTLDGYKLTGLGQDLFALLEPLGQWAIQWAKSVTGDDSDYWETFRKKDKKTD